MARVVVVDDDRDFSDMLQDILLEGGHRMVACNDSSVAVACIISALPDLILLDVRFGDQRQTGWTVLEQLREDPLTAGVPVIVMSAALDDLRARQLWLQQRGIPVLPKPFDMDQLLGLIDETLTVLTSSPSRRGA